MKFNLFQSMINHCNIKSEEWKNIILQYFNNICTSNNRLIYHCISCYFTNNFQCIEILYPSENISSSIKLFLNELIQKCSKIPQLYISLVGICFNYIPFEDDYFILYSQYIYQYILIIY